MYSYTWQDAVDFAAKQTKGTPMSSLDVRICDMVSSEIWTAYAWYISKTTIPAGSILLVDNVQDYSTPSDIYTLTKACLVNTGVTPNDSRELDVVQEQDINLIPVSPYQIRSVSLQAGVGLLRLEAAVVTGGQAWEIQGEYKPNPAKVTALSDGIWFTDAFLNVAVEGLVYWAYKISDDKRAGGAITQNGRVAYSGKYAEFRAAIDRMKEAEDFGGVDGIFPGENLASGRNNEILNIFGTY